MLLRGLIKSKFKKSKIFSSSYKPLTGSEIRACLKDILATKKNLFSLLPSPLERERPSFIRLPVVSARVRPSLGLGRRLRLLLTVASIEKHLGGISQNPNFINPLKMILNIFQHLVCKTWLYLLVSGRIPTLTESSLKPEIKLEDKTYLFVLSSFDSYYGWDPVVLPLWLRVNLGAMTVKAYSTFSKAPA